VPLRTRLAGLVPEAVVGVAALLVFGWAVDGASPWRDELVTLVVADRPVSGIVALTRRQDLVHLAYYLLVHPLLAIEHSITALRALSVLAVAGTAVVLVRIGRALAGWRVGIAAGLLLVASATASRYAQEARSFSLVAALVAADVLALIRATDLTVTRTRSTLRWTGYGGLLVLTGIANLLGLLAVLGHAVHVLTVPRTRRAAVLGRWLLSCTAAAVPLAPFLVLSWGQSQQVAWLQRPGATQLAEVPALVWTPASAAWAVVLLAVVAVALRGTAGARRALVLGLGWGLLPPLTLWTLSQLHPLYHEHYLFPQAAGMALAAGALGGLRLGRSARPDDTASQNGATATVRVGPDHVGPDRVGPDRVGGDHAGTGNPANTRNPAGAGGVRPGKAAIAAAIVPALALGVTGLPQQAAYRERIGHGEDVPAVAEMLTAQAKPGDAVVYLPYWLRIISMAYPLPQGVDEVALARSGEASATITGEVVGPDRVLQRLAGRCRIWAVTQTWTFAGFGPTDDAEVNLLKTRYDQVHTESKQAFDVMIFRSREPRCATS
jgi:hypothetical protein